MRSRNHRVISAWIVECLKLRTWTIRASERVSISKVTIYGYVWGRAGARGSRASPQLASCQAPCRGRRSSSQTSTSYVKQQRARVWNPQQITRRNNVYDSEPSPIAKDIARSRHGHCTGRLRLCHQDGVGWRQRGGRHHGRKDEDTAAGQRHCRFVCSICRSWEWWLIPNRSRSCRRQRRNLRS